MKYYNWNFKIPQVQYRLYGEKKKKCNTREFKYQILIGAVVFIYDFGNFHLYILLIFRKGTTKFAEISN
jgi:hypothetical protein